MFARNAGFIYAYNAIQCPMEAIHGRRSLLHNVAAGGILGGVGVMQGYIGIPFVDQSFFYRFPRVRPAEIGFLVYGGIAGGFAALSGKSI